MDLERWFSGGSPGTLLVEDQGMVPSTLIKEFMSICNSSSRGISCSLLVSGGNYTHTHTINLKVYCLASLSWVFLLVVAVKSSHLWKSLEKVYVQVSHRGLGFQFRDLTVNTV